ncbi:CD160 antigen [Acomys russatus]|uniref:CD160 antigen n=1 Tax=Acomys russatus TaxID=60746 RepID=UPI0021E30BB9|nr:CD160 antigen [Acomys russatus]
MQILMTLGQCCCALAILLAIVNFQHGGCIHIASSASQKGGQLDFTCTLWYQEDEAEGLILFWCKDRSSDCSPETSLKQLRVKKDPGTDGITKKSSELVFTIEQATPSDSGTYQCCARSQKPEIYIHDHLLTVLVTGNHTEIRQRQRPQTDFSHIDGSLSSGFLQVKAWGMLITGLVALQGMSRRNMSSHPCRLNYFLRGNFHKPCDKKKNKLQSKVNLTVITGDGTGNGGQVVQSPRGPARWSNKQRRSSAKLQLKPVHPRGGGTD